MSIKAKITRYDQAHETASTLRSCRSSAKQDTTILRTAHNNGSPTCSCGAITSAESELGTVSAIERE